MAIRQETKTQGTKTIYLVIKKMKISLINESFKIILPFPFSLKKHSVQSRENVVP